VSAVREMRTHSLTGEEELACRRPARHLRTRRSGMIAICRWHIGGLLW